MGIGSRLPARTVIRSIAQLPYFTSTLIHSTTKGGQVRTLSRAVETEAIEELHPETERKVGWVLKGLAVATFAYVGYNVFPLMGASFIKHSVLLAGAKDPFFRRSGAWRLKMIATDEERRLKIVEAGGVGALVDMIESAASDDETRREAVKALAVLSACDAAVEAFHARGGQHFMNTLSTSSDLETQQHTSILMERIEQWRTKKSS